MEFQADPIELNDAMEPSLVLDDAIFTFPSSNVAEELAEKMTSEVVDAASVVEGAVFDEVVAGTFAETFAAETFSAETFAETVNESIAAEPLLEPVVEEFVKQFQQTNETPELHDIVEQNLGAGSEIMKELAEQVQQSVESMELDNVLEPSLGVESAAAAAEMVKESVLTAAATNEEAAAVADVAREMASESVDFVASMDQQEVFQNVVAEVVHDDEATSSFGEPSVIEEITQRVQQTVPMILVISTLILGLLIIAFFVWRRRRSINSSSSKSSSSLEDENKEAEAEGNVETVDASAAQS